MQGSFPKSFALLGSLRGATGCGEGFSHWHQSPCGPDRHRPSLDLCSVGPSLCSSEHEVLRKPGHEPQTEPQTAGTWQLSSRIPGGPWRVVQDPSVSGGPE